MEKILLKIQGIKHQALPVTRWGHWVIKTIDTRYRHRDTEKFVEHWHI